MAQQGEKVKKPNIFVRFGRHIAKSWSELKKVSWPNFKTVAKNTGIVLVVVLSFTILCFCADQAFAPLMTWLSNIM